MKNYQKEFKGIYGKVVEEHVGESVFIRFYHPSTDFQCQGDITKSVMKFDRKTYDRKEIVKSYPQFF